MVVSSVAPMNVAQLLASSGVEHADDVRPVVHGELRAVVDYRVDVRVVGVASSPRIAERRDPVLGNERGRDVVLGRERVRSATDDVGPSGLQRAEEVRRLGRDVEARRHPMAGERAFAREPLPDRPQHRHLAIGPLDSRHAGRGQREILDVVPPEVRRHRLTLLDGRRQASRARPYRSSSRTTSSSSGVETSRNVASSSAARRWTVPGMTWKDAPGATSTTLSCSTVGPRVTTARPDWRYSVSSFASWYWRRERLPRPHEEHLPAVAVGQRIVKLVAPRLLDAPHGLVVGRQLGLHSGLAFRNSSAWRSSFGVFTVNQIPSWKYARRRRSAASSGNVVRSWSPRSGRRSSASSPST